MNNRVDKIQASKEDELDYRIADAAWQRHLRLKTKLCTPEESKRVLGLESVDSMGPRSPLRSKPRPARAD